MKSIIRKFVGAALLLALPLSFTSCDDILGPWEKSNPATPLPPTLPPEVITLKNALDEDTRVEFSYKIGDTECTAAFLKEDGKYKLVGGGDPELETLEYDAATNRLVFSYYVKDDVKRDLALEVYFDIATSSFFVINIPRFDNLSFDGKITIKDTTITLPNACPKKAVIASGDDKLIINYAEGDTWQDVYDRFVSCGWIGWLKLDTVNNEVLYKSVTVSYYEGGDQPVKIEHLVGKDGEGNAFDNDYIA